VVKASTTPHHLRPTGHGWTRRLRFAAALALTAAAVPVISAAAAPASTTAVGSAGSLTADAAGYHGVPPTRVVDSRDGTGTAAVAWRAGEARVVSVTGRGGVPSSGVSAVVANVTVTGGSAASHLTVWPAGGARPTASTVNWPAGDTRANLALLAVSTDGSVEVFNNAGSAHLIVDVVGWYEGEQVPSSAGGSATSTAIGMQTAGPHRLADTRNGTGTVAAPLTAGDIRTVAVAGVGPVPLEGVSAIVATVTVTGTTAAGHLTAWAADRVRPDTSNLNWPAGDTRANLVVIPVSADGRINLFTSSGTTHVIVDVVGWQLGPTLDVRPEGRGTISGTTTIRVVPRDLPAGPVELHLDDLDGPPLAVADGDPAIFTVDTAPLAPGDHLLVARSVGAAGTVVATHPVRVDDRSYDFSAVSTTMERKIDAIPIPGNALHVSHHGTQVYEEGFGTFDGSTVMPIASATKWISGATIMRLVDQGLLRLDTTVGEVLPSFTGAKADITLRQLLSFTSGLRPDVDCVGSVNVTLAACVDTIAGLPLRAAPGTQFRYGSSHLTVAARMAEVVTGKPWVQIVSDEVTGPLGLTATTYWNAVNPNPAGSLRSSLDDYQRFLRMVWNDGELDGVRYLSTAAVDQMQRDQTRGAVMAAASGIRLNQGSRYGLGQWVDLLDPATGAYEISSPGAFGFYPWIDRERDVYGVYAVYVPTDGVSGGGWDVKEQVRVVIDG
jgi:CubicO group peptidase (beta-lactamase class C family)